MRSSVLDALRGVAVILVMFRHYPLSPTLMEIGWIGVDLFFVLSGFLVSGLLFKEFKTTSKADVLRFLIRRGLKIYPLFYLFLGLTFIIGEALLFIGKENDLNFSKMPFEVLFLQNYFGGVWNHTWSLAVEEHFYLMLAGVVFLLVKYGKLTSKRLIVVGSIFVIGLIICLRFLTWQFAHDHTFRTHLFATHLRLDSLLFGVLLAYFYHFSGQSFNLIINRNYKTISIMALSLLSIVFIWPIDSYWMGTIGLTILYVAFGAILSIVIVLEERIMKMKWTSKIVNALGFIGFYSYSIYLFHTMVAAFLIPVIFKLSPVSLGGEILFVLYFIFSVGIGVVMSKLIEIPFLKFRDRFFRSNS